MCPQCWALGVFTVYGTNWNSPRLTTLSVCHAFVLKSDRQRGETLALACSAERPKGLTERWHKLRELKTVEHDTHSGGNNLSSSMVPRYPNRVLICSEVVLGETLVTWITCVVELIFHECWSKQGTILSNNELENANKNANYATFKL